METIERVKNYWDSRPCNLKHSNKEIGTKEYFEDITIKKYFVEYHIPGFAQFWTDKWKGKKVLEIGCGLGTDTISFALAGASVTTVDLSEKSIELAKKRAELFGVSDKIVFYQGNAEELDKIVPIEKYDLVYSFGVIHHSPNPEKIIQCVKKYMYCNSEFRLMVYNKLSWKVLWIILLYGKGAFWKAKELIAKYSEAQTGCPVTYTYTKKTVKELLKDFKIEQISIEHIFPYKIKDYIKHKYNMVWYFRWIPQEWFMRLEKILGWHLCIVCKGR